ncbi:efflux RND transporter periplasmic adaptor subunit [Gallaecimonas mangrovi]|uniref:efflux RND transporter periplasmic adaptor subunit n=1 Tax=Gallaecimonas mangrovi TaxID=2291597 RepID=UPI000E1FC1EA|nr:efflux RND transporter periplasmic adaptor subunit [Gallaecimonas mangrovi]
MSLESTATPNVAVMSAKVADVPHYLETTGQASAFHQVAIVARVAGTLTAIHYQDGQQVSQGQLLFEIDPATYQAQLQQAQASLKQAKASYRNAQLMLEREQNLLKRHMTAQSDVDSALASRDSASAQIQSAEGDIALAKLNLGYTRIRAPFSGVMSAHQEDVGSLVGQNGVTTLATLVQQSPIYVDFTLASQDIQQVQQALQGQAVTSIAVQAGLSAAAHYGLEGHLDYLAPSVDEQTDTQAFRAVFTNAERALLPGQFVRLRLKLGQYHHALLLPDSAIGTEQNGRYVMVVNQDNKVERKAVSVTAGPTGWQRVESGLQPNQKVVVSDITRLRAGMSVNTHPSDKPLHLLSDAQQTSPALGSSHHVF